MKKLLYLLLTVLIVACSGEDSSNNQNSTPVITIIGEANTSVVWGTTYTDAGATAFDSIDGDITEDIITTGEVNTSIEGNYTITYTVSNSSGNSASAIRQVTVEDDGNPVYLADNGVTIKAKEWAIVGDTGVVNGIGYTIVDGETLINMISNGDDLTRVCTSRIVDMSAFFKNNYSFNQDISSWDVSNVYNMYNMFNQATYFNQPIGSWDVSNVTDMGYMFRGSSFNQDISNWDVSNVSNMGDMFQVSGFFNQPIGNWDVSNVSNMQRMFYNATTFNQDLSSWSVDGVIQCGQFSNGTTSWTLPKPNFTNC
jgi:surface protein